MSLEVACGKCGAVIYTMRILKPVKDVLRTSNTKCPSCGQILSATEFGVSVHRV